MRISPGINKITLLFPIVHLDSLLVEGPATESSKWLSGSTTAAKAKTDRREIAIFLGRANGDRGRNSQILMRRQFTPAYPSRKCWNNFSASFLCNKDISRRRKKYLRSMKTDCTPRGAGPSIVLIIGNAAAIIYLIDRVTRTARNMSRGIGFQGLPRYFLDLRAGLRKNPLSQVRPVTPPRSLTLTGRGWPLPGTAR